MMKWIYDLAYEQLKEEILALHLKSFTADQIFSWLYAKNVQDINFWHNISKGNRQLLANTFDTKLDDLLQIQQDHDGTKKVLIRLRDHHKIEAVLIKEKPHFTFCISTQVGCSLKCTFCATGLGGFKRNLSAGEIVSQVLLLKKQLEDYRGKINIVLMGMGEPLLNYRHLSQALHIITSDKGIAVAPRHICLSTAGILDKIQQLERDFPKIKLSFSLNAAEPSLREQLMPITRKEPLGKILDYLRATKQKRTFRVTFEYVLIKGVNDSLAEAKQVARLIKGIPCKINLIPFNESQGIDFKSPDENAVRDFSDFLYSQGYTVIVRWSKGRGIKSACGQLAGEETEKYTAKRFQW